MRPIVIDLHEFGDPPTVGRERDCLVLPEIAMGVIKSERRALASFVEAGSSKELCFVSGCDSRTPRS